MRSTSSAAVACRWVRPVVLGLVCVSVAAATGCNERTVWVEEVRELRLEAAQLKSLSLSTENGEVQVYPAVTSDHSIEIKATVRVGGADEDQAEANLTELEIYDQAADKDDQQRLVAWRWRKKPASPQAVVSFEVHLPPTLALVTHTKNGAIHVEGVQGACELETHNGAITVDDASLATLRAKSHNGAIRLRTPAEDLKVETHNGAISAELTSPLELGGYLRTHNGEVRLQVSTDASAQLDCQTHNGAVTVRGLTLADQQSGRKHLSGRLGMGGPKLSATTHNGEVVVEPLEMAAK